jgi:FAD/FMN-containing dehydrogenase
VSATGVSLDLVRDLRAICGEDHVIERVPHADDIEALVGIAVSPATSDEIAAVMRLANERGFTVAPAGGGSEAFRTVDVLLHTDRLNEVEHYDPGDLTCGVGAGMTVAQLNAMVGAHRLMLAVDPPFAERTTIGGLLAAAGHGPLRHGYGSVRDFCIGIRFVTGDGRKAKGGGRVVKNVAGYDLMKLLLGSHGTLAVITSASFKLFPAPRQTRTFLAEFKTWQEALKFRDLVVRSPLAPMCLELVSPRARKIMRPEMTADAWVICLRAAGSDAVLGRYRRELGSAVTAELESEKETAMWQALADFPATTKTKQEAPWISTTTTLPSFSLFAPPAELGSVLQVLETAPDSSLGNAAYIGRCGIGHLLVHFESAKSEEEQSLQAKALRQQLPAIVQLVDAWQNLRVLPSMRAVKHALDPNNILRGRELL